MAAKATAQPRARRASFARSTYWQARQQREKAEKETAQRTEPTLATSQK
jgi:hypothetical protein